MCTRARGTRAHGHTRRLFVWDVSIRNSLRSNNITSAGTERGNKAEEEREKKIRGLKQKPGTRRRYVRNSIMTCYYPSYATVATKPAGLKVHDTGRELETNS